MNDEIWTRQFYKALEAVGKLTEVEKLRLANILIAVSDTKEKHIIVDSVSKGAPIPAPPEPPPYRKAGMF